MRFVVARTEIKLYFCEQGPGVGGKNNHSSFNVCNEGMGNLIFHEAQSHTGNIVQ